MPYSQIDTRLIPITQYSAPTTGSTVTVDTTGGNIKLLLNPAGTLATLTIAFPGSPTNGDVVQLGSTQIVTALTMNGGTILNSLSALTAGGFGTWVYSSTANSWVKTG